VHGRHNCNRLAAAKSSGGEGCDGSVVYSAGNLAYGVGRGRADEQQVCEAAHAAEEDMLHTAGDPGYDRMGCGVLEGVGVQYLGCGCAHDAVHLGPAPDQVANEVDRPHCGYAAGDGHYYSLSRKRIAYRACDI